MNAVIPLDETSRFQAAKKLLRTKVLSGEISHGEQFTPELELCRTMNLSRTTIRKALGDLVDEGLLVRVGRRGTFVHYERTKAQRRLLGVFISRHVNFPGAHDLMVRGAERAAARLGYQIVVANFHNNPEDALEQAIRLNELRVAGTLACPLSGPEGEQLTQRVVRALRGSDQKVVLIDSPGGTGGDVPSIAAANREPVEEMVDHLVARGRRRLAFLTGPLSPVVREREEGFRAAMRRHGLPIPDEYFLEVAGSDPATQGVQEANVFLAMKEPPDAIVCLHDRIALNVLRRCRERGWKVPEEVAVAGFDDLPEAAACHPALTTIHQPLLEIGQRAVEMLVAQLQGKPLATVRERIPCRLVVRDSA